MFYLPLVHLVGCQKQPLSFLPPSLSFHQLFLVMFPCEADGTLQVFLTLPHPLFVACKCRNWTGVFDGDEGYENGKNTGLICCLLLTAVYLIFHVVFVSCVLFFFFHCVAAPTPVLVLCFVYFAALPPLSSTGPRPLFPHLSLPSSVSLLLTLSLHLSPSLHGAQRFAFSIFNGLNEKNVRRPRCSVVVFCGSPLFLVFSLFFFLFLFNWQKK